VNCRTHEHRHFERTLRVSDSVRNPRLAEGRTTLESARTQRSPLAGGRTADGRAWTRAAGGRGTSLRWRVPGRSAAASQVASLNVTLADRAGGVALAASPTRPAGFSSSSARTVVSSRTRCPPRGGRGAVGGGPVPAAEPGGPSNDVGVVPRGASLSSAWTACVPAPRLAVHGRRGGGRGRIACATSDQVRLPAEFKHISKRRKRN
jgi:hypothetical protein